MNQMMQDEMLKIKNVFDQEFQLYADQPIDHPKKIKKANMPK